MALIAGLSQPKSASFRRKLGRTPRGEIVLAWLASAAWLACGCIVLRWPDLGDWGRGPEFAYASAALAAALAVSGAAQLLRVGAPAGLRRATPWLLALGLVMSAWEATSAKLGWLPQPFFPPPHAILEVFTDDWAKLGESVVASLKLELLGFALGAGCGFLIGVALGRSRAFGYWVHPILRLIGPLPAIA